MAGRGYRKTWRMTNMIRSKSNDIQSLISCFNKTVFVSIKQMQQCYVSKTKNDMMQHTKFYKLPKVLKHVKLSILRKYEKLGMQIDLDQFVFFVFN